MEFCDGNQWHYVTDPDAYLRFSDMYEMRACGSTAGRMYVDPRFAEQRRLLQPRLVGFLIYQFPYQDAGTPEKQAEFFCQTIGRLRPNEMVMLDTEQGSGLRDPVGFMRQWCAIVEKRFNTLAWIYVPQALSGKLNRAVTGTRIVKAPRYSGSAGRGVAPHWPWDVWQYSDRAPFPGSAHGPGDRNITHMSTQQLLGRCRQSGAIGRAKPTLRLGDRGPWVRTLQEMLVVQ